MNRRLKYSVEHPHIWPQKLSEKLNFVDHQLIFMLQECSYLHSSADNFLIEARMIKNYTIKLLLETLRFLNMSQLVQEMWFLKVCLLMRMRGQLLLNYGLTHGFRIIILPVTNLWYHTQAGIHTPIEAKATNSSNKVVDNNTQNSNKINLWIKDRGLQLQQ